MWKAEVLEDFQQKFLLFFWWFSTSAVGDNVKDGTGLNVTKPPNCYKLVQRTKECMLISRTAFNGIGKSYSLNTN